MTTRDDIRGWLREAKTLAATHMIVVCDTFDHEDYPVMVLPCDDVRVKYAEYNGKNMQRVMEIYSLTGRVDLDVQLAATRAFYFD